MVVNAEIVGTYWRIGERLVREEQVASRSAYGEQLPHEALSIEFGRVYAGAVRCPSLGYNRVVRPLLHERCAVGGHRLLGTCAPTMAVPTRRCRASGAIRVPAASHRCGQHASFAMLRRGMSGMGCRLRRLR